MDGQIAAKPRAAVFQDPGGSWRAVPDPRATGGQGAGGLGNGRPPLPCHGTLESAGNNLHDH